MTNQAYEPGAPTPEERREELLTAYLLGELDPRTHAQVEADLAIDDAFAARRDELAGAFAFVKDAFPEEKLSDDAVAAILGEARLVAADSRGWSVLSPGVLRAAAGLVLLVGGAFVAKGLLEDGRYEVTSEATDVARLDVASESAPTANPENEDLRGLGYLEADAGVAADGATLDERRGFRSAQDPALEPREDGLTSLELSARASQEDEALRIQLERQVQGTPGNGGKGASLQTLTPTSPAGKARALVAPDDEATWSLGLAGGGGQVYRGAGDVEPPTVGASVLHVAPTQPSAGYAPDATAISGVKLELERAASSKASKSGGGRDAAKNAKELPPPAAAAPRVAETLGEEPVLLDAEVDALDELVVLSDDEDLDGGDFRFDRFESGHPSPSTERMFDLSVAAHLDRCRPRPDESAGDMFFRFWGDHPFVATRDDALSTFAADADTSSYALARRYLADGTLPPREAVRTEEFVNYFSPDVAPPLGETFRVEFDLAPSAFATDPNAWMLRVAVRGKDLAAFERKPLALTFVLDVSGSMEQEGRLGLVKEALRLLATELSFSDSVALVAFNEEAETLLPMVSAGNRGALEDAFGPLEANGGTNVEAGLTKGYELASAGLVPGAVNRVVFLSDGVGNIGETDQARILAQVATMRERGIYLNTIGVGMGNHDDAFLEQLADKGDGVANYVDSKDEARRVMVYEFTETFQPIARDVKIQVEFDPSQVLEWRQLGYENRAIADADFRNDAVDAGELNAGHQVSALYELVRTPGSSPQPLATCRLRWKEPFAVDAGDASEHGAEAAEVAVERAWSTSGGEAVYDVAGASWGFRRALVAAQLAESLRRSKHARNDDLAKLEALAARLVNERPDDGEVAQLATMVATARPLLEAERARITPLDATLDALAERTYYEARLEQLVEAGDLAERGAAVRAEIEALEAQVRALVAAQVGFELEVPDESAPGTTKDARGRR